MPGCLAVGGQPRHLVSVLFLAVLAPYNVVDAAAVQLHTPPVGLFRYRIVTPNNVKAAYTTTFIQKIIAQVATTA
jgi:hypothetical protein